MSVDCTEKVPFLMSTAGIEDNRLANGSLTACGAVLEPMSVLLVVLSVLLTESELFAKPLIVSTTITLGLGELSVAVFVLFADTVVTFDVDAFPSANCTLNIFCTLPRKFAAKHVKLPVTNFRSFFAESMK